MEAEEAENLSAPPEEEDEDGEELAEDSMDEGAGGGALPSLGKRRSTDTASSAQTAPKRARPGSLAEVSPALLAAFRMQSVVCVTLCDNCWASLLHCQHGSCSI